MEKYYLFIFFFTPEVFNCRVREGGKNPTKINSELHIEVENKNQERRFLTSKINH